MNEKAITTEDVGKRVEEISLVVTRVIFQKGNFGIYACEGGISIKGTSKDGIAIAGQTVIVSGVVDLYGYSLQIKADSITIAKDRQSEDVVIATFLTESFEKIGKKTGTLLAKNYGTKVLEAFLKTPDDIAKATPGLSLKRTIQIMETIDEAHGYYEAMLELKLLGLSQNQAKKAIEFLGFSCVAEVKRNPYVLLKIESIGFGICENIAQNVDVDFFDELRVMGAVEATLEELHATSGYTCFGLNQIKATVKGLLFNSRTNACLSCNSKTTCIGDQKECIAFEKSYISACEMAKKLHVIEAYTVSDSGEIKSCVVTAPNARICLSSYFLCELNIKRQIDDFLSAKTVKLDEKKALKTFKVLAQSMGKEINNKQYAAFLMCSHYPFSIVTGGPGTGKTTVTGILAEHFRQQKISVSYCAPTGRAAKRLSEAIGEKAVTIHKLLGVTVSDKDSDLNSVYSKNADDPIDSRVVVVDEASMIDCKLFRALLEAIKPNSSIILLGDPNQLPSIGAGNVLADLLSCKAIPRVELEYIYRQGEDSSIAANAYRVLKGEKLIGNNEDFVIISERNEQDAYKRVLELYQKQTQETSDVAIMSPTKLNMLGTKELNLGIQEAVIEPSLLLENSKAVSSLHFYEGDKVMQIKNDYKTEYFDTNENKMERGIYNGEIGEICSTDFLTGGLKVRFDDKTVSYDKARLVDLDLAYAMTVHKAQGCEFNQVIIALGRMNPKLMNRKLLYTAITRGKQKITIVEIKGILDKIRLSSVEYRRRTSLADMLKALDSGNEPSYMSFITDQSELATSEVEKDAKTKTKRKTSKKKSE